MIPRAATRADIPAIEALIVDSALALSRGFYTQAQAVALTEQVFGVDTRLIDDGSYFVIEDPVDDGIDHEPAIVASGGWSRRGTLFGGDAMKTSVKTAAKTAATTPAIDPLLDPAIDPARIRAFFVASTHARRGLGSRLMEHCAAAAWHAGFRRLTLMATLPGVPLYRVFGFVADERIELALAGGVRAALVRMSCPLDGPTLRA
jgi:GNAT superfamily N-acetyltransferase